MITSLSRVNKRDLKSILLTLDSPMTFKELVGSLKKQHRYLAELVEWLVISGYVSVNKRDTTLKLTTAGIDWRKQEMERAS